jgi:hypothetical protein
MINNNKKANKKSSKKELDSQGLFPVLGQHCVWPNQQQYLGQFHQRQKLRTELAGTLVPPPKLLEN